MTLARRATRGIGLVFLLAAMLASFTLAACDSDSGDDNGGSGGQQGAKGSDKAYAVEATVSGGDGETVEVAGEADQAVAEQYTASVANGVFTFALASANGATGQASVIFGQVDTNASALPDSVTTGSDDQAPIFVSLTDTTGIYFTNGTGKLTIDTCPDANGKVVTGSFDGLQFANVMDGSVVTLDGTFKLTLTMTDGTQQCRVVEEPNDGGDGGNGGNGATCDMGTECDGPCCPYVPCLSECIFQCSMQNCMNGFTEACMNCNMTCLEQCDVSSECMSASVTLEECAQANDCNTMGDDGEECLAEFCCDEYKAVF